jgi:hypothetical protein
LPDGEDTRKRVLTLLMLTVTLTSAVIGDYLTGDTSGGGSNAWDACSLRDEDSTWLNVSSWS